MKSSEYRVKDCALAHSGIKRTKSKEPAKEIK